MAFSTGVSLLPVGGIPSTFTLVLGGLTSDPEDTSTSIVDVTTQSTITNTGYDAGFGTLSNITYSLVNSTGNGVGTYTQTFQSAVTSTNNTLRFELYSGASFAWRATDVDITATSSTGATRTTRRYSIRNASNYFGTTPSYSTSTRSGNNETRVISYVDPFNGATSPPDITIDGASLTSYEASSNFGLSYSGGTLTITLKPDKLGTFNDTLLHRCYDSWGVIGGVGSPYNVTATRNLQWYPTTSRSVNSNAIGMEFRSTGDMHWTIGGTDPHEGSIDSTSHWIGNGNIADILDPKTITGSQFFPTGTPYYQIKIANVSGDSSWSFHRIGAGISTPLNKDQWYDMSYNSSYPRFKVHLTSNDVNGVYTSVINVQVRNYANTASYSQNVTLTLTDS